MLLQVLRRNIGKIETQGVRGCKDLPGISESTLRTEPANENVVHHQRMLCQRVQHSGEKITLYGWRLTKDTSCWLLSGHDFA